MTTTETQIAKRESPVESAQKLIQAGMTVADLKGILEVQKDWEANEARKAYNFAMAQFKANPPEIFKDKKVGFETTGGDRISYNHATLSSAVEKIGAALSKYELSVSWRTDQKDGQIKVTCRIAHSMGHFEETYLSAGLDNSGKKNAIQQLGSTVTYLERYTLFAITGLASKENDDDGRGSEAIELISEQEAITIGEHLESLQIDKVKFLAHFKIRAIEDMPKAEYAKAINIFNQRGGAKK
jgi:hypothetical protein